MTESFLHLSAHKSPDMWLCECGHRGTSDDYWDGHTYRHTHRNELTKLTTYPEMKYNPTADGD